jgi:hypothetical protein
MEKIKSRLPAIDAIPPVLAVISFLVYGWTLVVFLWQVPSWILFLTPGEILVVLAYSMTSSLLESLAVAGILLFVCMLLPSRWLRDVFVTRGTLAVVFGLGSIMLYMYRFSLVGYSYIDHLVPWSLAGLGLTLLLTFISPRIRPIVRAAAWISDRMIVFLFLFIPISLVSLLVVLYRNLF